MKLRTTWVLLALALIVGGAMVWDIKKGKTTEERLRTRKRLVDVKSEGISRLELVRSNQTVVLEKQGERWQLRQPINYRASGSVVSSILSDIELAEADRLLTEKDLGSGKRAEFGLEPPRFRVRLATAKGPVTLLVGGETPTKEFVYAQVEGAKNVVTVRKNLASRLETSLSELRDHDVLDTPAASISRVEIKSADRLLELSKTAVTNAEPRWAIAKPQPLRADQRKVGDLVNDFTSLRVAEFISDDAKDLHPYQLDEPVREITGYAGDKAKTVQFGKAPTNDATKVFARLKGTDTVFTVSADTAKKFAVQPNDLRDAQILAFEQAAVHSIQIARPSGNIELVRGTNDIWRITAPKELPADDSRISNLLGKLHDLTATQFTSDVTADLAQFGLATPAATITLRDDRTNTLAQLLVGQPIAKADLRQVKRADEPFIYGVPASGLDWLPASELALRHRLVAEFKTNDVTKITIEKTGKTTTVGKDKDGKWQLVSPAEGVLDLDSLNQMLQSVSRLEAAELIREGFTNPAEFGLDKPEVKVTFAIGDKNYILQTGKAAANGEKYVFWSDPAFIFTIPGYALTSLTYELVTTPPPTPPAAATNQPPATVPKE